MPVSRRAAIWSWRGRNDPVVLFSRDIGPPFEQTVGFLQHQCFETPPLEASAPQHERWLLWLLAFSVRAEEATPRRGRLEALFARFTTVCEKGGPGGF